MKDTHTILNEIIVAAKECGQVMLQADRNNFEALKILLD